MNDEVRRKKIEKSEKRINEFFTFLSDCTKGTYFGSRKTLGYYVLLSLVDYFKSVRISKEEILRIFENSIRYAQN